MTARIDLAARVISVLRHRDYKLYFNMQRHSSRRASFYPLSWLDLPRINPNQQTPFDLLSNTGTLGRIVRRCGLLLQTE